MSEANIRQDERRTLEAYERRDRRVVRTYFGHRHPSYLLAAQEQERTVLAMLARAGVASLADKRILDVGCGSGPFLLRAIHWGANPTRLAGIDIRPGMVEDARHRVPGAEFRVGNGADLPWRANLFDIVVQSTVFSSILEPMVQEAVAAEMMRVLAPDGMILWYDYSYSDPRNKDTVGVSRKRVRSLFPGFEGEFRRVTLMPVLARRVPLAAYPLLSAVRPLRSHWLALLR